MNKNKNLRTHEGRRGHHWLRLGTQVSGSPDTDASCLSRRQKLEATPSGVSRATGDGEHGQPRCPQPSRRRPLLLLIPAPPPPSSCSSCARPREPQASPSPRRAPLPARSRPAGPSVIARSGGGRAWAPPPFVPPAHSGAARVPPGRGLSRLRT